MRILKWSMAALLFCSPALGAQSDSAARSKARLDSIAKAVRDSVALMKELGGALAAPGDTAAQAAAANAPGAGQQAGPTNPRLLPDLSAVGDLVGDLSPKGSTQPDGTRLGVREVEITVAAVVDPYFRGNVLFGFSDGEGVAIETAELITTSLPAQLEAHIGRFFMPFGKLMTTHRHDLHTIEYPYVIQRFFGDEGMRGTGLWVSRVFAPLGFFQELNVTAIDRIAEPAEGLTTSKPVNKSLGGLGYSARLRNYADLSEASNIEVSFSALTGRREQPLSEAYVAQLGQAGSGVNATNARQTTFGADVTYRWRPLQQGLYKSLILQGEVMLERNETAPRVPALAGCADDCRLVPFVAGSYAGPVRNFTGAYVFGRYQTGQRSYLGARYDYLQDPFNEGRTLTAGSGYLEYFPSEFSKLVAGYEATSPSGGTLVHRLLLQAVFALGPHRPHPF